VATDRKPALPTGLVLPLGTMFLYVYSYAFEIGHAMYFGYPSGLVAISVGLVINFGTGVFLYLLFFFGFLQLNLQSWPNTKKHVFSLTIAFIVFFSALIATKVWLPRFGGVSYMLIPLIAYFGLRATRKWRKSETPSESDKIPMAYDARSQVPEDSIAHAIVYRLGFDPLLFGALLLIVLPALFWSAGFADAKSRTQHYFFQESGSEYVILRFTGSSVIGARLDESNGIYYPEYVRRPVLGLAAIEPMKFEKLKEAKIEKPGS